MPGLADSLAQHAWAWWAVVGLGAFHGVNPGMGWLFAVSNGLERRRGTAVFAALPPIAAGHFLAMAVALLPFTLVSLYVYRLDGIRAAAALLLVAFGFYKLAVRRHPRLLNRIGPSHLVLWSFLMATAHGAGLMLVPVLAHLQGRDVPSALAAPGHVHHTAPVDDALVPALAAVGLHTAAMLVMMSAMAVVVYQQLGVEVLRRAWINLDLIWVGALTIAGATALGLGLWLFLTT